MSAMIEVQVTAVRQLTPVVREFSFAALDGTLPGFSCGSHVQVVLPIEGRTLRNAYSLLGDPRETGVYRIAVRLQEASRGGSRYLHEQVRVGDRLQIGAPRNLFALHSQARHHILVAGGIGITPFMAYLAELEAQGASFELHYAYRSGLTDATQVTPLLRLFQRRWWVDVGVSVNREHRGDAFVNLMLLF